MPLKINPNAIQKSLNAQGVLPNLDPVAMALTPYVQGLMQDGDGTFPESWRPGLVNALVGFWKRNRGDVLPKGPADVAELGAGARNFMLAIGGNLKGSRRIPWQVVDLINTGTYPQLLAVVDWPTVAAFLDMIPAGKFAAVDPPDPIPFWLAASVDTWIALDKQFDWPGTPWDGVPWSRVPWAGVAVSSALPAANEAAAAGQTQAATVAFIEALLEAFGLTDADFMDEGENLTIKNPDFPKPPPEPSPKKRDGIDLLLVGASLASAAAITLGAVLAYKRSKRNKKS